VRSVGYRISHPVSGGYEIHLWPELGSAQSLIRTSIFKVSSNPPFARRGRHAAARSRHQPWSWQKGSERSLGDSRVGGNPKTGPLVRKRSLRSRAPIGWEAARIGQGRDGLNRVGEGMRARRPDRSLTNEWLPQELQTRRPQMGTQSPATSSPAHQWAREWGIVAQLVTRTPDSARPNTTIPVSGNVPAHTPADVAGPPQTNHECMACRRSVVQITLPPSVVR